MTIAMYQASAPLFVQSLCALSRVLEKAEAYAGTKRIDPRVLLAARLPPDMFAVSRQVQLTCDFAKGAAARPARQKLPSRPDGEATFGAQRQRISETLAYVQTFKAG